MVGVAVVMMAVKKVVIDGGAAGKAGRSSTILVSDPRAPEPQRAAHKKSGFDLTISVVKITLYYYY
jgi:hypothetical protein